MRTLTLYGHDFCPLCHDMQAALRACQSRYGFNLEWIDITQDSALEDRFGEDVPVLMEGDDKICQHFLDEQALAWRFEA